MNEISWNKENFTHKRLDKLLSKENIFFTQGIIHKAIRNGEIKINLKKTKANYLLQSNDRIYLSNFLYQQFTQQNTQKKNFSEAVKNLANAILTKYMLFSCEHFIAIYKPAAIPTQGGVKINLSIDHALQYLNLIHKYNFKLVHRLDKDTSGILLIAKNYYSSQQFMTAFQNHQIDKYYIAILHGTIKKTKGSISTFITKSNDGHNMKITSNQNDKYSLSHYKVRKQSKNFAFVDFQPVTGRKHQIRLHAKTLNCPIVGDLKYGNFQHARMLLQCYKTIVHKSIFGTEYVINSKIDEDFQEFIDHFFDS